MNNFKYFFLLLTFGAILFFASCQQDNILPEVSAVPLLPDTPFDYKANFDDFEDFLNEEHGGSFNQNHFNSNTFLNGSVTSNERATLGRVLFYDKKLSKNNSISCASCHKQELAFSDNKAVSEGFGGKMTERNSMAIVNPAMNQNFFWDARSFSLSDLALRPIVNHIEMGMDSEEELAEKISQEDYYKELFDKAFPTIIYGSSTVTPEKISVALDEFMSSLLKADSRFDEGKEINHSNLNELEKHGMALFFSDQAKCSSCHAGTNFSAPMGFDSPYTMTLGSANVGLDTEYADNGFGEGKFRIPSLRNIALTGPYMHDGRFATLKETIEHYNSNIRPHSDLDLKLRNGGTPIKMGLTDLDIEALEAFLNTLTSQSITTDEIYSDPFKI